MFSKKIILLIMLISIVGYLFGQKKMNIALYSGYNGSIQSLEDAEGYLVNKITPTFTAGLLASYEFVPKTYIETGIFKYEHYSSVSYDEYWGSSSTVTGFKIPIRLKYSQNVFSDKFSVTPHIGGAFIYDLDYNSDFENGELMGQGGGGTIDSDGKEFNYNSYDFANYRRIFPLIEAGVSFDYQLKNGFGFSLAGNYSLGLRTMLKSNISYSFDNQTPYTAYTSTKGDHFEVLFGVNYQLSRLWLNKEEIKEKRQQTKERIKASGNKGFYIGYEIGLVKNHFKSNNPEIQGNDDEVTFRYNSNTIHGIKLGYNFTDNLGIETGFISQSFQNSFHIYDKGTPISGGGFWTSGTGFYNIPLKFKYYYSLFDNKLFVVPSAGISYLTHFVDIGEYDSMSGLTMNEQNEIIEEDNTTAYRLRKNSMQFNLGLSVEYALNKKYRLTLSQNYTKGFVNMNKVHVENKYNGVLRTGDIFYDGTGMEFKIGVIRRF